MDPLLISDKWSSILAGKINIIAINKYLCIISDFFAICELFAFTKKSHTFDLQL